MKRDIRLPTAPVSGAVEEAFAEVQQSFERLCLAAGMEALSVMMEADVEAACGRRHGRGEEREAHRWGSTRGRIGFHGGKVAVERPRVRAVDGRTWIVYLRITDELYIELLPGGTGRAGDQQAAGLNHLCLTTPDIEATAAHLASVGVPLVSPLDTTRRGVDGNRGMCVVDPDGNRIEIMEMAPGCDQYTAIKTFNATGKGTVLERPI